MHKCAIDLFVFDKIIRIVIKIHLASFDNQTESTNLIDHISRHLELHFAAQCINIVTTLLFELAIFRLTIEQRHLCFGQFDGALNPKR